MNSTSSPLQKGAVRGVRQVLRQLVGAEGAHADARRPPVQVQVGNSVEHLGLPWRRLLELSRPHLMLPFTVVLFFLDIVVQKQVGYHPKYLIKDV